MNRQETLECVRRSLHEGDERAFARLVHEHQAALRRFLLVQAGGDAPLADDLAQDTFVRAYTHLAQFEGRSSFLTWLFRIAYNVYFSHQRSAHLTYDVEQCKQRWTATPEPQSGSLHYDLASALQLLTPVERTCVTLQLLEQQTVEHIAEVTTLPINTVKSHLARGKRKLAQFLQANGYERRGQND